MKPLQFVRQNREKWERYFELSQQLSTLSPSDLARCYLDLSTDLAFAQTHYPDMPLTEYLEGLTLAFHQQLYARRPTRWRELRCFLVEELPLAFRDSRRELLLSLLILTLSAAIGWLSQYGDAHFADHFLGAAYMAETRHNIAAGRPMAIYASQDEWEMFWQILFNNCAVGLRCFLSGLLTLPAAVVMLVYNGVMLGVFGAFFAQQGLLTEVLVVPNMHGSLEVPAIVLSGAAGLALGTGWLFPGTKTRLAAFSESAQRGWKMMLATLPLFLIAAFIESFLTRHTELPLALRIAFVALGLGLILWLIVLLPEWVYRRRQRRIALASPSPLQWAIDASQA